MLVLAQTVEVGRARVMTFLMQPDKIDPATVDRAIEVGEVNPPTSPYFSYTPFFDPRDVVDGVLTSALWYEAEAVDVTPLQFKQLLTRLERGAILRHIRKQALDDDTLDSLELIVDEINSAQSVSLDSKLVRSALDVLVSIGVLTEARRAEVLEGSEPV